MLLEQTYPAFARDLDPAILRLSARGSWDWAVKDAEAKFAVSPSHLRQRFREALAAEFGEPVRAMLDLAVHGDANRKIHSLKPTTFVGRLRRALALATLRHQPPDLVVLDANPLENIRNTEKVSRVMLGGRLYDAATLNEQVTGDRRRAPYWWEGSSDPAAGKPSEPAHRH